jgi:hypothetical protein
VQNVSITSTVGGTARIANPWPDTELKVVARSSGAKVQTTRAEHGFSFPTKPGETYALSSVSKP